MCECVVESAIFTLKLKKSEISLKKLKRDFSVKSGEQPLISPWKCVNNLWFWSRQYFFLQNDSSIVNLFSSQWFIANTVTDPGDHERARVSPESARKGTQGQNWSQWFWWVKAPRSLMNDICFLSFFILLVSPWYMYKGSCFRDVCADTVVVGGYFRGSTGVYIYISLSIHIHSISFFRGQVKRVLSVNHVLSRTCKFNWAPWKFRVLTQHFRERCFQPQARAWELCFKP